MFEEMHKKRARRELRGKVVENSKIYCLNMKKKTCRIFLSSSRVHRTWDNINLFFLCSTGMFCNMFQFPVCFSRNALQHKSDLCCDCMIFHVVFIHDSRSAEDEITASNRMRIDDKKDDSLALFFFRNLEKKSLPPRRKTFELIFWSFARAIECGDQEQKHLFVQFFEHFPSVRFLVRARLRRGERKVDEITRRPATADCARDRGDWEKCKQFFVRILMWTIIVCGKDTDFFGCFFREIKNQFFLIS